MIVFLTRLVHLENSWNFINQSSSIENSQMISHACSSIKYGISFAPLFCQFHFTCFPIPLCQMYKSMLLFGYFAELTSLVAKFTLQSKLQSEQCSIAKFMLPSHHSQAANSTRPMQHCQVQIHLYELWPYHTHFFLGVLLVFISLTWLPLFLFLLKSSTHDMN